MDLGLWDVATVLCKAVAYIGTFGACGAVFFDVRTRGMRRLISLFAAGSVLGSLLKVAATANSLSGDALGMFDVTLERMVLDGSEGVALLARLLGLGCVLYGIRRAPPRVLARIGALVAVTSFAWVGHVHALAVPWRPALVLALHLVAAAYWLGALVPLFRICNGDAPAAAIAVSRFGAQAPYVVGGLLLAGVYLLCKLLGSPADLWGSSYGRLILVKLALVTSLLVLAAVNRWYLTPRLRARDSHAARSLRRSIGLEIVLAAGILLVTASLTTVAGPPGSVVH